MNFKINKIDKFFKEYLSVLEKSEINYKNLSIIINKIKN